MTDHVDVAIIGCGTSGLALARLLEIEGLRVAVVDRMRIPYDFPRATHLDDETMRAFQTFGLRHLEKTFSLVGTYSHYDGDWRPVMVMDMNRGVTEQAWQSDYMFHQPDFEAVLRGYAQKHVGTTTYFGWEAFEVNDSGDDVRVKLRELSTSEDVELRASYVVGCDGANSRVREFIGSGQIDHHATHRSLIVDIIPFVAKESLPGRSSFIQGGIRNPLTFVPIAEPRLRFELMLRPDDDDAEFERTDKAYEVLAPWFSPEEFRMLRSDVYEWRSLTADPWRVGRVFLAGDAAHTMPPHLGQGMCSGIRDATNLAWKLRRVVRGESPFELLDTYESERKPHVMTYTMVAAEMANHIEKMKAEPGEDPKPTKAQDALRPRLGPGIRAEDADELAGTLSPQPKLANEELLDDVVGYRFALVGDDACLSQLDGATKALLESLDVVLVDRGGDEVRAWLGGLGTAAVLLRPDRYIFASARSADQVDGIARQLAASLTGAMVTAPGDA